MLGVGVAVWGSRTLAPEVYTRFFSDSVTARVNEAVAQSGGDIAAALQQLDFLPESLRTAAANALQTAGDQLPEKLTALLEPLFLPLVQVVLFVLLDGPHRQLRQVPRPEAGRGGHRAEICGVGRGPGT